MNMMKPCVYHYLFSHIPEYDSAEEAKKTAENLVSRLRRDLGLKEDETRRLRQLSADVTLLSFHADEETETYLSQLLSHDLITTILTYNQTERHEEPLSFLQRKRSARFPEISNRIGETSVFFVQAAPDIELVKQIAEISGETQITESFPCCQFEWGALYALQPATQSRDAQQKAVYVLLIPQEENLKKGDHFLSHLFPLLEFIQHKLVFEEQEARKFKANNLRHEQEITRLLDKINRTLSDATQRSSFEADLRQVDTHQAALYQSIAETDAFMLTLHGTNESNLGSFWLARESQKGSYPVRLELFGQTVEIKGDPICSATDDMNRFAGLLAGAPEEFFIPGDGGTAVKQEQPAFGAAEGIHITADLGESFLFGLRIVAQFQFERVTLPLVFHAQIQPFTSAGHFAGDASAAIQHSLQKGL